MELARLIQVLDIEMPMLEFTESGRGRLYEVAKFLDTNEQLAADPKTKAEIEKEFIEKLKYLNGYGGETFKVRLSSDHGFLGFSLCWLQRYSGEYRTIAFNGGLQFDGVQQPFASVNIGEPSWWSIHT